ncbi:ABC transporter substrate-binding protein [Fundidesulfovibrio magnetotacticus]|nr:ABC transporter substrate-binding protein [Fundidesulfovibrio magnetotacticus]
MAVLLVLLLAGVVQAAELPVMRLSYGKFIDDLPFYVGVEKGFFEAEGVRVELVELKGETNIMAAAMRGDIDGGNIDVPASFHAVKQGLPIRVVSWFGQAHKGTKCGLHVPVDSPVKNLGDLKGRRVASAGSITTKLMLGEGLRQFGLTSADIEQVAGMKLDEPMKFEAALKAGAVDFVIT